MRVVRHVQVVFKRMCASRGMFPAVLSGRPEPWPSLPSKAWNALAAHSMAWHASACKLTRLRGLAAFIFMEACSHANACKQGFRVEQAGVFEEGCKARASSTSQGIQAKAPSSRTQPSAATFPAVTITVCAKAKACTQAKVGTSSKASHHLHVHGLSPSSCARPLTIFMLLKLSCLPPTPGFLLLLPPPLPLLNTSSFSSLREEPSPEGLWTEGVGDSWVGGRPSGKELARCPRTHSPP